MGLGCYLTSPDKPNTPNITPQKPKTQTLKTQNPKTQQNSTSQNPNFQGVDFQVPSCHTLPLGMKHRVIGSNSPGKLAYARWHVQMLMPMAWTSLLGLGVK